MKNHQGGSGHLLGWCVALFSLFVACTVPGWQEFRSEDDRFLALFPREPTKRVETANTPQGPLRNHIYSVSEGQSTFSIAVARFRTDHVKAVGQTAVLDGARDGAVLNTLGKLLSELLIELDGYPGREIKISVAGGKVTIQGRMFLVRNRLYQVLVGTPVDDSYEPAVSRFLDSFRLL